MDMIVECESCRSRFRLKKALLKESKSVLFRCRKCGGAIMVRNPQASSIPPNSAVPANIAAPPIEPDHSYDDGPGNEPPSSRLVPVPSASSPRIEGLFHYSPGDDVVPRKARVRRKRSPFRSILLAALPIILLAGGFLYFGSTEYGQEMVGKRFPSWGLAARARAAAVPAYEVRQMKSAVHEKVVAGHLFVVSGTVVNVGKGVSRGIQMRATLLGQDNQVLMANSSIAGNLIDETTLRYGTRNPIEADLKLEHREGGERRDLLPGESLPFMVVFFNPPEKIGSIQVEAVDAD